MLMTHPGNLLASYHHQMRSSGKPHNKNRLKPNSKQEMVLDQTHLKESILQHHQADLNLESTGEKAARKT